MQISICVDSTTYLNLFIINRCDPSVLPVKLSGLVTFTGSVVNTSSNYY